MGLFKTIFERIFKQKTGNPVQPPPPPADPLTDDDRELINKLLKDKGLFGVTSEGAEEFRKQREKELRKYREAEQDVIRVIELVKADESVLDDNVINERLNKCLRVLKEANDLKKEGEFRKADTKLREEIPDGPLGNFAWFHTAVEKAKSERERAEARENLRKANLGKDGDAKDLQTRFPDAYISVEEADWKGVLQKSPLEFCESILSGLKVKNLDSKHFHIEFKKAGPDKFVFSLNLEDPDRKENAVKVLHGENLISLTRTITVKDGKISMGDERTDVNEKLKPGFSCKELYKNLLPLYIAMGVEEVTMSADEVGSYAWVRYGFRPSDTEAWVKLRGEIRQRLSTLIDEPPTDKATGEKIVIDKETQNKIEGILKSDDPSSIVAIADMENAKGQKLGYPLLHKSIWKGTLRLKDEAIVKSVKKYIGLKE